MSMRMFSIGVIEVTDRYGDLLIGKRLERCFTDVFVEIGSARLTITPFSQYGRDKVAVSLEGYDPRHHELAAEILKTLKTNLRTDYDFGALGETPTRGCFMEAGAKSIIIAGRKFGPEKW
ncbi:MAG: hypothetical protein HY053_07105 [Proteobacteria bacterium]|nr:hypothetical protein [Pseudomonadota bacterium]